MFYQSKQISREFVLPHSPGVSERFHCIISLHLERLYILEYNILSWSVIAQSAMRLVGQHSPGRPVARDPRRPNFWYWPRR